MRDNEFFALMRKFFNDMSLFDDRFFDLLGITESQAGQPIVYGYSCDVGPDGIPHYSVYSNAESIGKELESKFGSHYQSSLPTPNPVSTDVTDANGYRIPHSDLLTEEDQLQLIVELPGVEKKEVAVSSKESTIIVSTTNSQYKYKLEVPLPFKILPKKVKATFKNGILELKLLKDKNNSETDESNISVD